MTSLAPVAAPPPGARTAIGARAVRTDIQALRAVAVAIVLVFHVWPGALPGGFVGVDVFFVISGFLITSHLLSRPPRTASDLARFWARRVRRLLPASLLVLVVTLAASRLVAPETRWASTAREVIASALYVENWHLARTSVDYLAADAAPSPVQHFWSLSVEEQFYAVWPVLLLVLAWAARRSGASVRTVVGVGLVAVLSGSFGWSVWLTAVEPASAYFVTPTRIWELAAGAVLAVALLRSRSRGSRALTRSGAARVAVVWAGLAAIFFSAWTYTGSTPFPGYHAAVPVLGAVAVIAAGDPRGPYAPGGLLALPPIQRLGDISYSVYLWHWPLVVLVPYVIGPLGALGGTAVVAASVVLAGLTKTFVEDRFRRPSGSAPLRRPFQAAALAMAAVVALALVQLSESERAEQTADRALARAVSGESPCLGAAALAEADCRRVAPPTGIVPAPAQAMDDRSEAYARDCFEEAPFSGTRTCTFGDDDAGVSIALVGNSHAGHWLPAVQRVAAEEGWRITTYMASECTVSTEPVQWDADRKQRGCLGWARRVVERTRGDRFDAVVVSQRNGRSVPGRSYGDSYDTWLTGATGAVSAWDEARTRLLVLHDTATPGATLRSVPDCVAEHPQDLARCSGERDRWVPRDAMAQAVSEGGSARARTVDLNDLLCGPRRCEPVVGGVLVYYDASHMTNTYARTLAPYLRPALVRAVEG